MSQVDKASRLKEIYEEISDLKNITKGVDSGYYKSAKVTVEVDSNDFEFSKNKTNTFSIGKDNKQLLMFINLQTESLLEETKRILRELSDENE